VAQKVSNASFRKPFHVGHVQFGDIVDERTVQSDQAVVDEAHHGGRNDRLRAGRDRKNGILLQCRCRVSITAHAKGFMQYDHAASGHHDCHARTVAVFDPAGDELAQSRYTDRIHSDVLR